MSPANIECFTLHGQYFIFAMFDKPGLHLDLLVFHHHQAPLQTLKNCCSYQKISNRQALSVKSLH
mgnify:CR=1 FL=1